MECEVGRRGHTMSLRLVVVLLICIIPAILSSSNGRASMRRIGQTTSMTSTEQFLSALRRSKKRVENIEAVIKKASVRAAAAATDDDDNDAAETPITIGNGDYLMEIAVGTPAVRFQAIADTGSDLIWTQCLPCQVCYNQSTPIFDPAKSSTYSAAPCADPLCRALGDFRSGCNPNCSYTYRYGDGSSTSGVLSHDKLTIGGDEGIDVAAAAFGCAHDTEGGGFEGGGLVGLGRGRLSLVTQAAAKFSYCLLDRFNDPPDASSPMFFGDSARLRRERTLTLRRNAAMTSFWYLPITGITVAGKAVDIPEGSFDFQPDGSGGMIIDSGTTLTYLYTPAYNRLVDRIQSLVRLPPGDGSSLGLDLCYDVSGDDRNLSSVLPSMALNFVRGVDMELPTANYFVEFENGLLCLALLPASSMSLSILGNVQQQNFHIQYDNARNTLSFEPEKCASL